MSLYDWCGFITGLAFAGYRRCSQKEE